MGGKDVEESRVGKGVALIPWPSGRLVGAVDLTGRADCHLMPTPELKPACMRV